MAQITINLGNFDFKGKRLALVEHDKAARAFDFIRKNVTDEVLEKLQSEYQFDLHPLNIHENDGQADIVVPDVRIGDDKVVTIDGNPIHEDVFEKEMVGYRVRTREECIDNLICWYGEAKDSDKKAMRQDLQYLIGLSDEFVFDSIVTNKFVAASDRPWEFSQIAQSIIDADADILANQHS